MISRKRFNKERLLSSTLLEMLLILLFLLLAISSIHQRLIQDQQAALESGDKVQPGNIQIDESLYNEVMYAFGLDKEDNDGETKKKDKDEEVKLKELLTKAKEHSKFTKDKEYENKAGDLYGVNPPPCVLPNGRQVLFDIDFAGKRKSDLYLIKVRNLSEDLILRRGLVLKKDAVEIWDRRKFLRYANALMESKRINIGDEICDPSNDLKYSKSAYCYECTYVMNITDLSSDKAFKKPLSKRSHRLSEADTKAMMKTALNYFLLSP